MQDQFNSPDEETVETPRSKMSVKAKRHRAAYMRQFRARLNQPENKIRKKWADALATLSEPERVALLAQQDEAEFLSFMMARCVKHICINPLGGIRPDGASGRDFPPPDLLYRDVRTFIEKSPLVSFWCPDDTDCIGSLDLDATPDQIGSYIDDLTFARFGLRTRLWSCHWRQFVEAVTTWAKKNPADCDSVFAELVRPGPTTPAQAPRTKSVGVPPLSETAEKALLAKKENDAIHSEMQD